MPPLPSRLLTWLLFARPLFGGSVIGSFTCARAPPLKGRGIHFPHGAQKEGGERRDLIWHQVTGAGALKWEEGGGVKNVMARRSETNPH